MVRAGRTPAGKHARQLDDRRGSGGIVVGAVVNAIAVFLRPNPQVIQMRSQQDCTLRRIGTAQNAHHVPGLGSRHVGEPRHVTRDRRRQRRGERGLLQETALIAARHQTETGKQRGRIESSQMLIPGAAAPPLEFIGREKAHIATYARDAQLRGLGKAERPNEQQRTENCLGERAHRESIMEFFRVLSPSG